MMLIILILLSGAINRLCGWESGYEKWHGKYVCALMMGSLWGIYAADAFGGVIVALGYGFWARRGWGDYMDFSSRANTEIGWIDQCALPFAQPWRDGISMAFRGLYGMPLFVLLGCYQLTLMPMLCGIWMAM